MRSCLFFHEWLAEEGGTIWNRHPGPTDYLKAAEVERMRRESSAHRSTDGRWRPRDQGRNWEEHISAF